MDGTQYDFPCVGACNSYVYSAYYYLDIPQITLSFSELSLFCKVTVTSSTQVDVKTRVWSLRMYMSKASGKSGKSKGSILFKEIGADDKKIRQMLLEDDKSFQKLK